MNTSRHLLTTSVHQHLEGLLSAARNGAVEDYRQQMYRLGVELACSVEAQLPPGDIVVAATVEDADWLLRGVLDGAHLHERARVFCYWNNRINEDTALITSSYEEAIEETSVAAVIVIKSIIAGA